MQFTLLLYKNYIKLLGIEVFFKEKAYFKIAGMLIKKLGKYKKGTSMKRFDI